MAHDTNVCPVCCTESISKESDRCPQCNADLDCFRLVDELAGHARQSLEHNQSSLEKRIASLESAVHGLLERTGSPFFRTASIVSAMILVFALQTCLFLHINRRKPSKTAK